MIKLATVGTSLIAEKCIKALNLTARFEHSAVYSRKYETGAAFAAKVGCDTVFTDISALAKSNTIDAVYIATPNAFHFEQSRLFLENGKHVICEKPIVTETALYRSLKKLADSKGLIYMDAIKSRYSPARTQLKNAVSSVGNIAFARIDFGQFSSRYNDYINGQKHNIFDMSLHAGTLMDLGVYCVYGAVDLFGMPKDIKAGATFFDDGCDKSGYAVFDYGDFSAILTYSKAGQSVAASEIAGDRGTVHIRSISNYDGITVIADGQSNTVADINDGDAIMRGETDAFADFIEGKNLDDYAAASHLTEQVLICMDKIKISAGLHYGK